MIGISKLQIRKVTSTSLIRACRRFLAQDPVINVLSLGYLYPPLIKLSDVYSAIENGQVVGVCAVYRAYPIPNLIIGTNIQEIKQVLIEKALDEISGDFISLCQPQDINIFRRFSTILHHHSEWQMIGNPPKKIKCREIEVEKVTGDNLELLNKFYLEHGAEAWVPIQFKAGPYYCVKDDDKIVSAAGVQLVTPQIAQLGNIITDEAYRNRGFATACTSVLASDLASKGRIISLFVRTDNAPAIHTYKKLGFHKANDIAFIVMRARENSS